MNSRMKRFEEVPSKRSKVEKRHEPDRISGTTKIRTYVVCGKLFSRESTMEKLLKRAELCSGCSEKKDKGWTLVRTSVALKSKKEERFCIWIFLFFKI